MPKVGIVMGSDSDLKVMSKAAATLEKFGIDYEMTIISAHRMPDVFFDWAKAAEGKGIKVIIAGAGMAAHLPGMCAALFPMPVIGIPMSGKNLEGMDALYSIVQMPPGIPVATVAIDGGMNAAILAAKMLAMSDPELLEKLKAYSAEMKETVQAKADRLAEVGYEEYLKEKKGDKIMDYKTSGVDIEAGYRSVELMKKYVKETMRPEVLGGLGGFSGAFSLAKIKEMEEPVLLSGTDGCGTKVKLAMVMDKHDTIGIDAVAMCVNDIACAGGEPLFFLDYIACGKNYPEKIASIVKGVAEGCKQSDAALIGGETAEHPGLMPEDEYDLAGFAVGVCDKKEMITGENLKAGDVLIGMASSGVHSNGFSLVRKVFDITKESLDTYYEELGTTLGEALLAPTRIYVKALKSIKNAGVTVKACSHITGGGFYENIPRMLKDGTHAVVEKDSYPVPPIFAKLAKDGEIEEQMMYNTFNMGLGMILAVDPEDVEKTMDAIRAAGDAPYVVGKIEEGEKGVTLC